METKVLILIMFLLIVGEPIAQYFLKKYYQNKVFICFKTQDYEGLEKILNNKIVRFVFLPFNVEYCRLNEALLANNKKMINKQFDILLEMKLNEHQKEDVYLNGFNYYLSEEDNKKIQKFYKLSRSLKNEDLKKSISISYNIFVEKGYDYLDEILQTYEQCEEKEKYINEYLLSVMYRNKGDCEKAKHFETLAKTHE